MAHVDEVKETHAAEAFATKSTALLWPCTVLALAALGTAGSLYLSIGQGLKACPLCFYQRTFIMAVFALLVVGLAADRTRAGFLCLLGLPLALGGLGVAAFHEYLVLADKLECPNGLFGLGTAPAQSLAVFALLTVATVLGAWSGSRSLAWSRPILVGGSAVLGLLLSWGCIKSSPPMKPPTEAYDPAKPFDTCRPPFRSP